MKYTPMLALVLLSGCGLADVGTTAVTTGKLAAEQSRQSQQNLEEAKAKIDAAMAAEQQRLQQAEANASK